MLKLIFILPPKTLEGIYHFDKSLGVYMLRH